MGKEWICKAHERKFFVFLRDHFAIYPLNRSYTRLYVGAHIHTYIKILHRNMTFYYKFAKPLPPLTEDYWLS